MTGNRYFAEAVRAHGLTHVFFVPTIMIPAMAEMEDMDVRRVVGISDVDAMSKRAWRPEAR
jgi:acetolactate synthase-1/2/3 large subunit